jgi:DNA polymerase-3 subunit gamma/tau
MWATKYRPSTLDGVLGQDYVKQVLRGRLQKNTKESHGWMLVGPYGAGKTTILRILAKSLACPTPSPSGEACHKCQSCQAIDADASLNYREIDAASYSKADDIRDLVVEAKLSPTGDSPNRVIALDEAHVMSKTAQNVLLKTLEETPPTTHIILITTDPQNLLPTIKSRCLTLELSPVEKTHVVNHLAQICKLEEIEK